MEKIIEDNKRRQKVEKTITHLYLLEKEENKVEQETENK